MSAPFHSIGRQLRAVRRASRSRSGSLRGALGNLDERVVFVFGSPRSGTTFLASAIGSCPEFVDMGEIAPFKAAIPDLAGASPSGAGERIRRIVNRTRRLAAVGQLRAVEQTPETAFVLPAVAHAFPEARLVHIVRDGRDVVCSLLERGWLSEGRSGADDAGLGYGPHARFWVEAGREAEFEAASDVRRAAWAWRRYVAAARASGARLVQVRYEELVADPRAVAETLATELGMKREPLENALAAAHGSSVRRFEAELDEAQRLEVETEAGLELRALGYLQ